MGKREVTILDNVVVSIAKISLYTEGQGLPTTAKNFVDPIFSFFEKLSGKLVVHKRCSHKKWKNLNYHCASYKKKYVIAYLDHEHEIVICDFVPFKLLK